ncbi:MAG TPA: histidine kinase dimerization/phospho-acceptor domain-containing protein, partial [Actinomycetes bacterium]
MAADRRWRPPGTVRVRTTLAALLVVGVAVVVGGVMLVAVLRDALTGEVLAAAGSRAAEVAADLESGTRPDALAVGEAEDQLIQVVDERGRVVRASPNVHGLPPVARLRPGTSARIDVPIDNDDFLAVAVAASTPRGRLTVLVARVADMVGESTRIVTLLLAVGLPVLLLVVAATTWKVVGRALAPVEAIRREVDEISAVQLHRRVPDPPGDDEVARLARTMNRMLGRLQRAHQRQRRFVADASHELRCPVASIRQHAVVALVHPGSTTIQELAARVLAEDLRIERLVEDLLLLACADEHALPAGRRQVDLDDLVFDEARRLRAATGLEVDVGAVSAGRVDGDADGLRRMLRNLGDNAARHA